MNPTEKQFMLALRNPFHPDAIGVKVPDMYRFPTQPYHIKTTIVLQSTAANGGAGCVLFFMNPHTTFLDVGAAILGGASVSKQGGSSRFASGATILYGLTNETIFGGIGTSWRPVAGGIRVNQNQAWQTAQGRIYIAELPASYGFPNVNALATQIPTNAGYDSMLNNMGLPPMAICASAAIQNYPDNIFAPIARLNNKSVRLSHQVYSDTPFNFKATTDTVTYNAVYGEGDNLVLNTPSSVQGHTHPTSLDGTGMFILYYEGLPTAAGDSFSVDLIQHYEVVPVLQPQTTTGFAGITPSPSTRGTIEPRSNPLAVNLAIQDQTWASTVAYEDTDVKMMSLR